MTVPGTAWELGEVSRTGHGLVGTVMLWQASGESASKMLREPEAKAWPRRLGRAS